MIGSRIEHAEQLMIDAYKSITDTDSQIVPLYQQNKIKIDTPQVVSLGDGSEYQTITLYRVDTESNNDVPYVRKQYDKVSNLILYVDQDHPDVSKVCDGEDPTKKSFGVELIEVGNTSKTKITPTKSQTGTQSFMCDYCGYTNRKRYMIKRHMKIHSNVDLFKCTICDRFLKTKYSLKNHYNIHNGIKPFQCERCPRCFITTGRLASHVQYKHINNKPHKCTICGFTCVELRKIKRHMRAHENKQIFQCSRCTFTSSDTFQFKQHLYIHNHEKLYKCDLCNTKFSGKRTFEKHCRSLHKVLILEEKEEFKCYYCPVICHEKNSIRRHIQCFHFSDESIQCEHCNETFTDRYQFKIHCKSHTFEVFKCMRCPYTSRRRHYFNNHLLTHTKEKPFHCKTCNKSFRLKYSLLRHCEFNSACTPPPSTKKTYQNVCNICQRSFARKRNLIRHGKVHKHNQLEMTENEHEDKD